MFPGDEVRHLISEGDEHDLRGARLVTFISGDDSRRLTSARYPPRVSLGIGTGSASSGTAEMVLPEGRDRSSYAYAVLLSLGVLDAAAYSIIAPVAPAIAERTGTGPGLIGALVASFPVGIVLGFVLAGIGVRRGRYLAVLLLSLGLLAVGSIGFALADSLPGYFAARVVMGLGSGGLWMGVTFSTLDRWPGQEYLCMSRIFAAYSVGGLVGPALGAIGGVRDPFLAYFALVCLAALLASARTPANSA